MINKSKTTFVIKRIDDNLINNNTVKTFTIVTESNKENTFFDFTNGRDEQKFESMVGVCLENMLKAFPVKSTVSNIVKRCGKLKINQETTFQANIEHEQYTGMVINNISENQPETTFEK